MNCKLTNHPPNNFLSDSCDGGFIQFYADFDCNTYTGMSPISALIDHVLDSKMLGAVINCTTAATSTWSHEISTHVTAL